MTLAFSAELAAIIVVVVGVAGAVNGVAGFGFAVVGTMVLAATLDPATAVAFMIVPMFAVNVALVGDLTREELHTCGTRFAPLLVAALVGTIAGMALLDRLPEAPVRVLLGLVSHGLFVGVVALVFVGINGLRVAAAGALGFYPDAAFALASVAAAVPAVGGVAVGKRLRGRVSERLRRGTVLGLLTVIGVRLVLRGAGVL
jgi:uncharacterized membrane protein YfcA